MEQEQIRSQLSFLQTNRTFLGREFLTWLWFKSESQNHKMTLKNYGEYELHIDDKMTLTSASGSTRESSFKGGTPAYAQESLSALTAGKMIQEAKFVLQNKDYQWMFSLNAEDLSLRGIKLPEAGEKENLTESVSTRIEFLQILVDIVQLLFKEYLNLRLSKEIFNELNLIHDWIASK